MINNKIIGRRKVIASFELFLMIFGVFAFAHLMFLSSSYFVSAATVSNAGSTVSTSNSVLSEPSVCCEKIEGSELWCVNTDAENCAEAPFKKAPTSCESTSYCRLGTCYNSRTGICMENTPQRVCQAEGGAWDEREIEEVPQCQLGCCIIADQAAFVSLTRCKRLSTLYGVENNFKTNIDNEVQCIAEAQSQDVGACVYELEYERVCDFTTRSECGAGNIIETVNGTNITLTEEKRFYQDYLCSAEELNTVCARQTSTSCYQGDVYWFDSCGNRENVYYGGSNENLLQSWNSGKVAEPEEVCSPNSGDSKECGNCDYLLGTRCAEWEGILGIGKPSDSDYYCRKNVCTDRDGNERKNGESWCVYDNIFGNGTDRVGARYYKEVCVDGEVRVEPCADFRNEVCIQGYTDTDDGEFSSAACRVNRWQDCIVQTDEDDCTNIDRRDCTWKEPITGLVIGGAGSGQGGKVFSNPNVNDAEGETFSNPLTGNAIFGFGGDDSESSSGETAGDGESLETTTNRPDGVCVPSYSPGFEFWEEGDAKGICSQATARCVVKFEEGLLDSEPECVENCECLEAGWAQQANEICVALGDCGGYLNYNGEYTDDGYEWDIDGDDRKLPEITAGGLTGNVIVDAFASLTGRVVGIITGRFEEDFLKITPEKARQLNGGGSLGLFDKPVVSGTNAATGKDVIKFDAASGQDLWTGAQLYKAESVLAPGTYTSGTIGGHAIASGQVATIAKTDAGYSLAVKDAAGKTVFEKTSGTAFTAETAVTGAAGKPSSTLSSWLGTGGGVFSDALLTGLQWATLAYLGGQLVGGLFGLDENNTNALSLAAAAGFGWHNFANTYVKLKGTWAANPLVSIGIGVVIFVLLYKDESTKIVDFDCLPWQAPSGGNDCEICNEYNNDGLPCSEYRCKSLGQNCDIVNEGTDEVQCVNVNPNDVTPPVISPNEEDLTFGYEYTDVKSSPPGPGFRIINVNNSQSGECVGAFEALEFGIKTDEPSQCKIDFESTESFDEMRNYFGGRNLYDYEHSEIMALPGAEAFENSSITLENDKTMNLFIRCKDKNGNENAAEYNVRFCVDPTPDVTAPQIGATSINNGQCVAEEQTTANVDFYVNEPADCRWSFEDQDYDSMDNNMDCSADIYRLNALQLYTCNTELTGVVREGMDYYIRCKDNPGKVEGDRNEMKQSFEFSLRGSTGLKMKNLQPNETIFGSINPAPVELYVETLFGCNDGKASCEYSTTGNSGDYVLFFDTNNEDGIHTQRLDLGDGRHTYYVRCIDEGGNVAEDSVTFDLEIDENAPVVARAYEEDGMLKIVTVRNSECSYITDDDIACDFSFDEGAPMPYANTTNHVAEWIEDETYYIKCRDDFRSADADCSIIVQPTANFF